MVKRCWANVVFSVFAPVPSTVAPSQSSKPTACNGSFWERIWGFTLLAKWRVVGLIPGRTNSEGAWIFHHGPRPNLSALEQSWLHDRQWCVASQVCLYGRQNRTLRKTSPLGPVDAVSFHGYSYIHRRAFDEHINPLMYFLPCEKILDICL